MIYLAATLIAILIVLALWLTGWFPTPAAYRKFQVTESLQHLLLERAEGRIAADEFEARQALLHTALLEASATTGAGKTRFWMVGIALAALAAGVFIGIGVTRDTGGTAQQFQMMTPAGKATETQMPQTGKGFLGTLTKPPMNSGDAAPTSQSNTGGDIGAMAKRLEKKMEGDPNNGEGWLLLARAYIEIRQHKNAANAFSKAAALLPPDASMLADWADAHVVANNESWDDTARAIVKKALAADEKNHKALSLAGSEAFARTDYKAAISYWKRMKNAAPAGSMSAKLADSNIEEATALLKGATR